MHGSAADDNPCVRADAGGWISGPALGPPGDDGPEPDDGPAEPAQSPAPER